MPPAAPGALAVYSADCALEGCPIADAVRLYRWHCGRFLAPPFKEDDVESCLAKAEAKLLNTEGACSLTTATECRDDGDCLMGETCIKDLAKYESTVGKCEDKFESKWAKLTQEAAEVLDPCPDGLLAADIQVIVDAHVA